MRSGHERSCRIPRGAGLSGRVSSAVEGEMGGVLVSAQLNGSTITTTVVTDASGKYAFQRTRLPAGTYAIGIRAIGFDLEAPHARDTADPPLSGTLPEEQRHG